MNSNDGKLVFIQAGLVMDTVSHICTITNVLNDITLKSDYDKEVAKAYVSTLDIQMSVLESQRIILQRYIDDLAAKLAG